jgi:CBS domain-containing protein
MKVEDVMSREVVTVRVEMPLKDVAAVLAGNRISGAPVCDVDGRVLGVISEHDILFKERGEPQRAGPLYIVANRDAFEARAKEMARTAGEAMTAPAVTIEPDQTVVEAARRMLGHGVNRLPVVRDSVLVGIVTRADLVRVFARPDTEIAREIKDDLLERAFPLEPEVRVEVSHGEVTLSGEMESRSDAQMLEQLVANVPGVAAVDSRLQWKPDRAGGDRHGERVGRRG